MAVYGRMLADGMQPTTGTYTGLITAWGKNGKVSLALASLRHGPAWLLPQILSYALDLINLKPGTRAPRTPAYSGIGTEPGCLRLHARKLLFMAAWRPQALKSAPFSGLTRMRRRARRCRCARTCARPACKP